MLAELSIARTNRWPGAAGALHPRAGQGQHRQQHGQELEEQQQVPPQPLEQAVDVQVFQAPPPEQRARHLHRPPPQLEEVQRDDPDRHAGQHRPRGQAQRRCRTAIGKLDRARAVLQKLIHRVRVRSAIGVRVRARGPADARAARPCACGSSCRAGTPRPAAADARRRSSRVDQVRHRAIARAEDDPGLVIVQPFISPARARADS